MRREPKNGVSRTVLHAHHSIYTTAVTTLWHSHLPDTLLWIRKRNLSLLTHSNFHFLKPMSAQFVWLLQMMFNIQQRDLDEQIKQTSKQFNWRGGRCWRVMQSQNFRTAQAQPANRNIQIFCTGCFAGRDRAREPSQMLSAPWCSKEW